MTGSSRCCRLSSGLCPIRSVKVVLNVPPPINYVDPWTHEVMKVRMRQLCAQPRRIAYFYERADTSTFRYRVFNPGLTLAANPSHEVSGAWFDRSDLSADDGFIVEADALVICRARYNSAVAQMISRVSEQSGFLSSSTVTILFSTPTGCTYCWTCLI